MKKLKFISKTPDNYTSIDLKLNKNRSVIMYIINVLR